MSAQHDLLADLEHRASQLTALKAILLPMDNTGPGGWYTLSGLVTLLKSRFAMTASEAGISARLRDLRKGGWQVDRQKVSAHRYQYRVWSKP